MKKQVFSVALLVLLSLSVLQAQSQAPAQAQAGRFLIHGQVLNENGQPIAEADVQAMPDALTGRMPSAVSDNQGRFTVEVYKTGRFKITALKPKDGYPPTALSFYYPAKDAIPEVIVKPDAPPPFVTVRMGPPAGNLSVRVADDESKRPVQNVQLSVCRVEVPRYCRRHVLSSQTGSFRVLVPAAPVAIEISAAGYNDWYAIDEATNKPRTFSVPSNSSTPVEVSLIKLSSGNASAKVLEAPQPLSPESGTEFSHFPRLTRVEWSQVSGAVSYTVEVDYCEGVKFPEKECKNPRPLDGWRPPTSGIEGTNYEFSFIGGQPGRWRVWAVDAQGRPGTKSAWSYFVYRR